MAPIEITWPEVNSMRWDVPLKENVQRIADAANAAEEAVTTGRLSETELNNTYVGVGRAVTTTTVLAPWRSALEEDPASVKIPLVGDSTRDVAAAGVGFHNAIKKHICPGGLLEGMLDANILNYAYNGQTVQQITSDEHMVALAAETFHLGEFSMGINNMRVVDPDTGVTMTVDKMETILVAGIEKLRAAKPGVPWIGTIPNSFLTTDVGAAGYVVPNGDAQLKSTRLRAAYLRLVDRWPDVIIRDTAKLFGVTSLATSPYMGDQIHPNSAGTDASALDFATLVGRLIPASAAQSAAARASAPYSPWATYGREVEDPSRYALVAEVPFQNQGATYIDIGLPSGQRNNITRGDIIELPDGVSYQLAVSGGGVSITANGAWTRVAVTAVPANTAVVGRGTVRVWRRRTGGELTVESVIKDSSWRYKKHGYVVAGSGAYVDISAASVTADRTREVASDWAATAVAGDLLYVEGVGATPATVTAGQFAANGANLRLTSGLNGVDFSTLVGRVAVLVGTHA